MRKNTQRAHYQRKYIAVANNGFFSGIVILTERSDEGTHAQGLFITSA
jgi:hypothetical protein